jgi:hypothetical protein
MPVVVSTGYIRLVSFAAANYLLLSNQVGSEWS